jgi:hypothetical protein
MGALPSVRIVITVETRAPHVYVSAATDGEYARLEFWLRSTPRLAALVRAAVELESENAEAA